MPAQDAYDAQRTVLDLWFGGDVMRSSSYREAAGKFFRAMVACAMNRWRATLRRDKKSVDAAEAEYQSVHESKRPSESHSLVSPVSDAV